MNENIDIDKEGKDILIGFNPRISDRCTQSNR